MLSRLSPPWFSTRNKQFRNESFFRQNKKQVRRRNIPVRKKTELKCSKLKTHLFFAYVALDSKEDGFGGDIRGGLAGPVTKLLPGLPKPKLVLEGDRLPLDPPLLILLGALGALGLGALKGTAF
jgi:hypothetical protein